MRHGWLAKPLRVETELDEIESPQARIGHADAGPHPDASEANS